MDTYLISVVIVLIIGGISMWLRKSYSVEVQTLRSFFLKLFIVDVVQE